MSRKIEIDYNKIYYNSKGKAFKVIKEVDPRPDKMGNLEEELGLDLKVGMKQKLIYLF